MSEPAMLLPPHSADAEQSVLGALLLDNGAYDRVAWLDPEAFYQARHRDLYRTVRRMLEAGRPADLVTVCEALGPDLERIGGPAYVAELAQNTPSALNVLRYAEVVRDKAYLRGLMAKAHEIAEACVTGTEEPRAIVERAEAMVLSVMDGELGGEIDLPRLLMQSVDRADEARKTKTPQGLRTGFADLDRKLGGLHTGLYVVAARPSVGKTALALNIAEALAESAPVAFFSLEMDRGEISQRLLANDAGVALDALRSGRLTEEEVNRLAECASSMGQRRLLLDDRGAVGIGYIRARCRRWKRKHGGLAAVFVDYLQLMRGEGDNREQEVSSLSRGLKALAKELHVPVIALCQLNRALEGRPDKRPQLYDLRESGAIEQDADVVLMLYREDLHGEEGVNAGLCQVLIRKHRNGPLGDATLRYTAPFCRFESTLERFSAGAAPIRPVGGFRATRQGGERPDVKMRAAGDMGAG